MKLRSVLLLVIAAGVAVAAAYITQRKAPTVEVTRQEFYPNLLGRINDAHAIEIKSKEGAVNIVRTVDGWVVKNFDNYPALLANIKRALLAIAALKIIETKTAKPENYATLQVEDVTTNAQSRLVTVAAADSSPLVALLVGKERSQKTLSAAAHYVRRAGENIAYLVEGELELAPEPTNWIDTSIANLPVDRVRRVTVHPKQGPAFTVSKASPEVQLYTLEGIPAGNEVHARATVSSIGGLLLDAKLEKVITASKLDGLTPRTRAEIETFDGLSGIVEAYDYADEVYIVLKFAHRPELAGSERTAESPEKVTLGNEGPKPTPPKTAEEVAKEAAELNARVAGWAYSLPDYKSRLLDKTLADLIKKKEPAEKPPVNPESAPENTQ